MVLHDMRHPGYTAYASRSQVDCEELYISLSIESSPSLPFASISCSTCTRIPSLISVLTVSSCESIGRPCLVSLESCKVAGIAGRMGVSEMTTNGCSALASTIIPPLSQKLTSGCGWVRTAHMDDDTLTHDPCNGIFKGYTTHTIRLIAMTEKGKKDTQMTGSNDRYLDTRRCS
jgi:hypothetical protein